MTTPADRARRGHRPPQVVRRPGGARRHRPHGRQARRGLPDRLVRLGKSTLLRCLNLLEQIDDGVIRFDGEEISDPRVDPRAVRRRIGMVFQAYNLFPHLTVLDNCVLAPIRVHGVPRAEAVARARELLDRFGLSDQVDKHPDRLSGGQQQRAALVRALCTQPELLLLDEITAALDPELVGDVLTIVRDLAEAGTTMVLATHEMSFARDVATTVCFLDGGRILEQGPPSKHAGRARAGADPAVPAPGAAKGRLTVRRTLEGCALVSHSFSEPSSSLSSRWSRPRRPMRAGTICVNMGAACPAGATDREPTISAAITRRPRAGHADPGRARRATPTVPTRSAGRHAPGIGCRVGAGATMLTLPDDAGPQTYVTVNGGTLPDLRVSMTRALDRRHRRRGQRRRDPRPRRRVRRRRDELHRRPRAGRHPPGTTVNVTDGLQHRGERARRQHASGQHVERRHGRPPAHRRPPTPSGSSFGSRRQQSRWRAARSHRQLLLDLGTAGPTGLRAGTETARARPASTPSN